MTPSEKERLDRIKTEPPLDQAGKTIAFQALYDEARVRYFRALLE